MWLRGHSGAQVGGLEGFAGGVGFERAVEKCLVAPRDDRGRFKGGSPASNSRAIMVVCKLLISVRSTIKWEQVGHVLTAVRTLTSSQLARPISNPTV
jgi:hypothetical protein